MAKAVPRMAPPAGSLDAKLMSWGAGEVMHRVHDVVYPVDSFNPSLLGNARFSPIRDSAGNVIPTLYAATTPQGALMETVFHDVPYKPGFKRVSVGRLKGKLSRPLSSSRIFSSSTSARLACGDWASTLTTSSIRRRHTIRTRGSGRSRYMPYTHKRKA
jgi:hypothetical protein